MTICATALETSDLSDWRDSEALMFRVMAGLQRGEATELAGASPLALQRLGYLAELVLLFLDPANSDQLQNLVTSLKQHPALAAGMVTGPAIPAMSRNRPSLGFDDLARRWHLSSSVSLARYRTEIPALLAS